MLATNILVSQILKMFYNLSSANPIILDLTLSQTSLVFTCLQNTFFENTVGKGEIACKEQFLLFAQHFLPFCRTFCHSHQM